MKIIQCLEDTLAFVGRAYDTKPGRYVYGVIELLLTWITVAVLVVFGLTRLFPSFQSSSAWSLWVGLGVIVGLLAGIWKFRKSVRGPQEKDGFSSPSDRPPRPVTDWRKRVHRNRVIALFVFLCLSLFSALLAYVSHR